MPEAGTFSRFFKSASPAETLKALNEFDEVFVVAVVVVVVADGAPNFGES